MHSAAVPDIVRTVPHDAAMIAVALLHDVVEDKPVTIGQIEAAFGADAADLVGWLTDVSRPGDGNRAVRKALDRDHLAAAPAQAQTIKVADRIDNTKSLVAHDPGFARIYLREKAALLGVLVRADQALVVMARRQVVGSKLDRQV